MMARQPAAGGSTAGTVSLALTTVTYGGQYAPRDHGAVWFEKTDGSFIKTAKRWAGQRHAGDLVAWNDACGGWPGGLFSSGGNAEDTMDAVSQATLRNHETHSVSSDFNVNGEAHPCAYCAGPAHRHGPAGGLRRKGRLTTGQAPG